MAALEIVELEKLVQVSLDLLGADVPGRAPTDSEALVEERSVHALDEAVGARAADAGGTVLPV